MAKRGTGNHAVKSRSLVSGGGRKPFRQKGTGRARQGTLRAPQFRGGGVVFGPTPRDHSYKLPKKIRRMGLKHALADRCSSKNLVILDTDALADNKTKLLAQKLSKNAWQSVLFITGEHVNENLQQAAQNIVGVDVLPQQGANVYSILRRDTLVLTVDALHHLVARLQ